MQVLCGIYLDLSDVPRILRSHRLVETEQTQFPSRIIQHPVRNRVGCLLSFVILFYGRKHTLPIGFNVLSRMDSQYLRHLSP